MSNLESRVRMLQMSLVVCLATALLAIAIAVYAVRKPQPPAPRYDRHVIHALVLALYMAEHPRPVGADEDPEVRKYDDAYDGYQRRVLENFDHALSKFEQQVTH